MRPRLSAAVGESVALNVQFRKNGKPTEPHAVRALRIYKQSVREENLVVEVVFPTPLETDITGEMPYDGLLRRLEDPTASTEGDCGTDLDTQFIDGAFVHDLDLDADLFEAGIYFDVWCFIGDESAFGDVTAGDRDYDDEDLWICQCNKFFVNDADWQVDDFLTTIRMAFEPLDSRFQHPEKRTLEVGLMPMPLYDFDFKKFAPIIPHLDATITFETQNKELLIDAEEMSIGLRQGSFRSNPYVLQYLLDTNRFLKGTYRYRIDVQLPNGETRSSPYFNIAIR